MEIRRTTQSSNVPIETETRETLPQQPATSRGVGNTSDSFDTAVQPDLLSLMDPTLKQTEQNASSEVIITDNSLQKQLEESLIQANNIFHIPKKPKITIGAEVAILSKLSQLTGKSPAEIEALFKKYGLDPANLPNPPDAQVAALFNDPSFDSVLAGLKGEVASTHQNLVNQVKAAEAQCNAINQTNLTSDTSVFDNLNTTPFKFLYDASDANGRQDSYSEAFRWAREGLGQRTGSLLSAMYPGEKIVTNYNIPEVPGAMTFNGKNLNICPSSSNGKIQFTSKEVVDWPYVPWVPFYVDAEGDGKTLVPSWMKDSNYPIIKYDY